VVVSRDEGVLGRPAADVQRELEETDPAVALGDAQLDPGVLLVYPANLRDGEAEIVADRVRQVVAHQPVAARL
jgi:hypothetical protein